MSRILALDTSAEACSCALNLDGQVFEQFEIAPRQHTNLLLPMIKSLMNEHSLNYSDLDAISVGCGPGSFTGLRIAAGVAQGIAFGAELPVLPISTLAALAYRVQKKAKNSHIFSCIDARINEVYWGLFEFPAGTDIPVPHGTEKLCKPGLIPVSALALTENWYGVGNGLSFYEQMNEDVKVKIADFSHEILPHAEDVAFLAAHDFEKGLGIDPADLSPVYIRDKVTHG